MNSDVPVFVELKQQQKKQEIHLRITLEFGLLMLLLGIIFFIRVTNLNYNTLFIDEAINAVIGEDLLAGHLGRRATTFHFGSYLYPVVAGVADRLAGVPGLRIASAITNSAAAFFVYLTTRSLFDRRAALFAMLFFGLSGVNINLGQLAVYDSLAVPFLAASLCLVVIATQSPQQEKKYLVAASACLILTVLAKYVGLIYIPALCLTAFTLYLIQGRNKWAAARLLLLYFILPAFVVLSTYGFYFLSDLRLVAAEQGYSRAERSLIGQEIVSEMWMVALPALLGLLLFVTTVWRGADETPDTFKRLAALNWPSRNKRALILPAIVIGLLLTAWLAAPLYHWLDHNIRSLWKNVVYSLIFLAPLAGYVLAAFIVYGRGRDNVLRLMGLVATLAFTFLFVDKALDSNWAFHRSWPDASGAIEYMRQAGLNEESRVLAEAMDVYEYYFNLGIEDRDVWASVWYMKYGDLYGYEAMQRAIRDHYFDFVVLEGYYQAEAREVLEPVLAESGYVVGFQETQPLRTGGSVLVQVFVVAGD